MEDEESACARLLRTSIQKPIANDSGFQRWATDQNAFEFIASPPIVTNLYAEKFKCALVVVN